MKQIPNIEEIKKILPCIDPQCDNQGTTITVNSDGEPEQMQCEYCYRERFPILNYFHQQLQKAREELAEEVRLLVVKYYKTDEFDEVGFLNELQAELDQDNK